MLIQRLQPPLRAVIASIGRPGTNSTPHNCLNEAFAALNLSAKSIRVGGRTSVRYASHKAQGAVNKAKDGPGKRLGAKKSGEQYVIPGNIIFRQRGTHWFPGENCAMGRDHTIYATESGYVKYYKDPEKHPKRQYIGVVFEREMVLPLPRNSMRRRRLGMTTEHVEAIHTLTPSLHGEGLEDAVEVKLSIEKAGIDSTATKIPKSVVVGARKGQEGRTLTLRPGYMYREANWEIGRAAERAKVKVREFKPRDRWTAWRKTSARKAKNAERKGLTRRKK